MTHVSNLVGRGGGNASDPTIGAVLRAIRVSLPGSPIYVFTDAPPSDKHYVDEAKSSILAKNTPIYFALTDLYDGEHSQDYVNFTKRPKSRIRRQVQYTSLYEQLATISGGQVINMKTQDIPGLVCLMSSSSIVGQRTIFRKLVVFFGKVKHSISIDSLTSQALISISGDQISVSVFNPQGKSKTPVIIYELN